MSDKVDPLRLYFGDPYSVTDEIVINQPSMLDVMEYGENDFFSMFFKFIGNTTYRKVFLWEMGYDWNKVSDYELFCNLVKQLSVKETRILFGDIDFTTFDLYQQDDPDPEPELVAEEGKKVSIIAKNKWNFRLFERTHVFFSEQQDIAIDANTYHYLVSVLREMVKIYPKTEYTASKTTKEIIIQEELDKAAKIMKEQKDTDSSTLLPLISFACNYPGFKYKRAELKEVKLYEFMDAIQRIQIIESTRALTAGAYSGFCDTSKVPQTQFDFMRPIPMKN